MSVSLISDLPSGFGWLYRPIPKGFYAMSHLYDGTVDLYMVAEANDYLDMEAENERRYVEALKNKH